MRRRASYWTVILTLLIFSLTIPPKPNVAHAKDQVEHLLVDNRSLFTANQGQWPDEVLFRTEIDGVSVWFTRSGLFHQFTRPIENQPQSSDDDLNNANLPQSLVVERMMVAARYVGGTPDPIVDGFDAVEHSTNYLIGDDPTQWQTNIQSYRSIRYQEIYPGIDMEYYITDGKLEYDLILAPTADPSVIELEYVNTEGISIDSDGSLVATTAWGEIRENAPIIYQMIDDERQPLAGAFELIGQTGYRFELNDQPDADYPLIIDPVVTYVHSFGGSGNDEGFGIAVDDAGSAYITGYTNSSDFPVENPFQVDTGGGFYDAFVAKLTASGTGLVYSTYLGGSSDDRGQSIEVDASGSAYVTGFTFSTDFPIQGAFQSTHGGGVRDAFVIKLNPLGDDLEYGTYLGGNGHDVGIGLAVSDDGEAYIVGNTRSSDFPTLNPYQSSLASINFDAFLTVLDDTGGSLIYSSFLGGSVSDYARDVAIDQFGNAYIVGYTNSNDFPTLNPFQADNNGDMDGFVSKLAVADEQPMYSSYIGGSGVDYAYGIAVDENSFASITGFTFSTDFPTQNAYQSTHGGGDRDMFLARLNSTGNNLLNSTYFGGSDEEYAYGLARDNNGNICLTGTTYSSDFPTLNPHQASLNGNNDAVLVIMNATGDQLNYSTYLGGGRDDIGYGVSVDGFNNVFITGVTGETFTPDGTSATNGSTVSAGGAEIFAAKFVDEATCCGIYSEGLTGNADCSPDGKRNLTDITRLIDRVYLSKANLCCEKNGNVDGDPSDQINLTDITKLIDHVYISKAPTSPVYDQLLIVLGRPPLMKDR